MRKNYLVWFVLLTFLLLGCRNEDFVNQSANTKREEEFFWEALSKTARIKNGNTIVAALKRQNEKSHFVSKMKDQSGLPIWDKMLTVKKPKTVNKGEGGDGSEEYIIPLTENDKDLSSILYVTKHPDDSFTFNNVDNEMLKQKVFNTQIDKDYREQLLLNFIAVDNLSFSKDAVYWNIPDDLLSSIPQSTIYPQRRFTATVDTSGNGESTNNLNTIVICVEYELECTVCDDDAGHNTHVSDCLVVYTGGGGGGGDGGTTPGNPDTGGGGGGGGLPTGNPGNNDNCGGANKAFYKIIPDCDDGGLPPAVQTLKNKLSDYEYYIDNYTGFLSDNIGFANKFNTYLNQNNNPAGAQFVFWGLGFLSQNPSTTWEQFINSKHDGEPNSSIDIQNNISGNYDETSYGNFDFENPQTQWPTVNSVIPVSDFVGWNAPGINKNCMDYAKAQIAKKGYKISNYYDVDSKGEKQTFQIYTEQNGVNLNDLYKGVSYIKYALSKGIPVIVGVDDDPGSPGNLDNSTDHFVVIVGMGVDSKGQFFRFFDNASGNDPQNQGANPENKFYYNYSQKIFTGKTFCSGYRNTVAHDYIITMIRKSK